LRTSRESVWDVERIERDDTDTVPHLATVAEVVDSTYAASA
jgi:hypothetical protein